MKLKPGDSCPRGCGTELLISGEGDLWCVTCGWRDFSLWSPQSPNPTSYGRTERDKRLRTRGKLDIVSLEATYGYA